MVYSIPYDILLVFLMVLAIIYKQKKDNVKLCQYITLAGLSVFYVFFAFRGLVFTDWMSYYGEFDQASWSMLYNYNLANFNIREPLYVILLNSCKSLVDNYYFFIIVDTTIFTILLTKFFRRYSDNLLLCLVLFMAFSGIEIICNLIRNLIAIGIFLNALPYLKERKPLQYFGLCLLALGFHFSSIIYFPLYFFLHRRMNKWVYLSIFVFCIVVFILKLPILTKIISLSGAGGDLLDLKVDAYSDISGQRGLGLGFIERLITGLLVFCYYDKLNDINKSNAIFINALTAFFIFVFMLSDFAEMSKRLSLLFVFSYWIIWGQLIKCFAIENNRHLFTSFLCIYCLVKTMTTVNQPVDQYDNILFGAKSYQERQMIYNTTFKEAKY